MKKMLSERELYNIELGDTVRCVAYIVNNRFLALSAEEVSTVIV